MGLLPQRQAMTLARIEPYGMIIIIALVFLRRFFQNADAAPFSRHRAAGRSVQHAGV